MKYPVSIAAILACSAGSVSAQSSEFFIDGFVELEYFSQSGSNETIGYGSVDLGFSPQVGGIGATVGVDAFQASGTDFTAVYAALTYSTNFGTFQIGAPRAALDDYVSAPTVGGLLVLESGLFGTFDGSALPRSYLLGVIDTPVGLRFDGEFGQLQIGTSLHSVDDVELLNVGLNYGIGAAKIRGGLEFAKGSGTDGSAVFLGAEQEFGPVNAGVLLSRSDILGDVTIGQLYATYKPIEKLELGASLMSVDESSGSNTLYGVTADYSIFEQGYVQGGVADGSGSDALYNLSLGLKF
jgi:hypothetical protein